MTKTIIYSLALAFALSSCNDNTAEISQLKNQITELQTKIDTQEKNLETLEKNKEVVRNFYQGFFGDLNFDAANQYIGDVYIQHNPAVADGRQALINAGKQWFANAPKKTIEVNNIIAEEDLVFIQTIETDQDGTRHSTLDIFRVTDGKISEHWDAFAHFKQGDFSANENPLF